MNAKIKKHVVPNLPYLFIFWFFCKVGTAYRLAAGADFGAKLIGMMKTIGPAFGKVFNSVDFRKSMHYNPMAYIKTESDVLKFVNALITNTKGQGKEGDEFWTKAETLLYCALVAYIVFEGPEEERNMNTLVKMINSMEVREDDESFKNGATLIAV